VVTHSIAHLTLFFDLLFSRLTVNGLTRGDRLILQRLVIARPIFSRGFGAVAAACVDDDRYTDLEWEFHSADSQV
jgi:hypothetical protein